MTVPRGTKPETKTAAAEARRELRAARRRKRERAAQRQMAIYVFTLLGLGGLYWYSQGDSDGGFSNATRQQVVLREAARSMLRTEKTSIVEPMRDSDRRKSDGQRKLVEALARRHVGVAPSGGSLGDLRLIQKIIDRRVLETDQSFELQALGVTLGDVMARQLELKWVIVNDKYGRTRALQYGDNEDVFFPITMVSRRYEADLFVDVEDLYDKMAIEVEKLRVAAAPGGDGLSVRDGSL